MPELVDKIAVVTGASSGIGQAIAVELARAGAHLVLAGRNADKLNGFADVLRSHGAHALPIAGDLGDTAHRERFAAQVLDSFGGLDVFVHAAGMAHAGGEHMPDAEFEAMLQINLVAAHSLTRLFLPSLKERRGQIAYMISRAGKIVVPEYAAYCASKFALRAYADALREELRPHGVRVLSVLPGKTDTPMLRGLLAEIGKEYTAERYCRPADVARCTVDALMLPRHLEVPELVIRPYED
jgi:short-subunit dehydrogenase